MVDVREQKELLIKNIEENELLMTELKEAIKADKSKLKKIEKLEKEMQNIFDDNIEEEIPGQMSMDGYAA